MGKRNSYLINGAIKNYLAASVVTMVVQQLNVTIDGIIVSNLIGPDALSAINLFMPVEIVFTCLYTCFGLGGTILASKAIGSRDWNAERGILMTSIISLFVAGLVLAILGYVFCDDIVGLMCSSERLEPYFKDYMITMLTLSAISLLQLVLNQIASIEGHPRISTKSCFLSVGTNVVLDLLFVGVFGMGIAGSALASNIGYLVSVIFVYYCLRKHNVFKMYFSLSDIRKYWCGNALQGLPMMISNILMMVMIFLMNVIVQTKLGADGMFVLSVCVNVLSLSMMLSNGFGSTAMAIGGNLFGQKDFEGLRMLLTRCLMWIFLITIVVTGIVELFPQALAGLFGGNNETLMDMSTYGLRIFILVLMPFCITTTLINIFPIVGYSSFSPILALMLPVILVPSMYLLGETSNPQNLWFSFPITGVMMILTALLMTELVRWKQRSKNLSHLTLVPFEDKSVKKHYASIGTAFESVAEAMNEANGFLEANVESTDIRDDAMSCIEELSYNIAIHGDYMDTNHYFDLCISYTSDELNVMLKDDGKPFDPTLLTEEKIKIGLKIVKAFAPKMEYKYMYGQNITFLTWKTTRT